MPSALEQALAEQFDPFSWTSQAARAAQEHPMPVKRSAESADVIAKFLTERQSKRQCLQVSSSDQSSTKQLAVLNTGQSALLQPPPYSSRAPAVRGSLPLPIPLPSPGPVAAPSQLPFRTQGTPFPSRFAKPAVQPKAFARPANPPPMFSSRPTPVGPFSMGATRQDTRRPQHPKAPGLGMASFRSGRSATASMQGGTAPANSRLR